MKDRKNIKVFVSIILMMILSIGVIGTYTVDVNAEGETVAKPTFSKESGFYDDPFSLEILAQGG